MYAAEKHASEHHGAIHWGDSKIAAVFGNDGYCDNYASQVVVGLIREQLREAGIRVLAFGLDDSGNTWTLLVESNDLEHLHAVASAAWKVASESNPDDLEWKLLQNFRTVCDEGAQEGMLPSMKSSPSCYE
jgi:hypothetical protein